MQAILRWNSLVALGLLLSACSEATIPALRSRDLNIMVPTFDGRPTGQNTQANASLRPGAPRLEITPETPPEDANAPLIRQAMSDAGFIGALAYGGAQMQAYATDARQTNKLVVMYGNTKVADHDATNQGGPPLAPIPGWINLTTPNVWPVSAECGYSVHSSTQHRAWFSVVSIGEFNAVEKPTYRTASQPPCNSDNPGSSSGSGGGGGSSPDAGIACLVYFEYDVITLEITYTRVLGCG